jgi:hypothetical protein
MEYALSSPKGEVTHDTGRNSENCSTHSVPKPG